MVDSKSINIQEIKLKAAYDWAVSEQKRNGLLAQPIRLTFDNGDVLLHDASECYVSFFHNDEDQSTIMRRDWDKDLVVQYNVIINYDEIKKTAPESLKKLLQNGVDLKNRYMRALGKKALV